MKKRILATMVSRLRICIAAFILAIISLFLFSFTLKRMQEDFLKQLGITKTESDGKITRSLLGGYLDHSGIRNMKNILVNDRESVIKDLAAYAKQYVLSDAFKKQYAEMKEQNKPAEPNKPETPEEMRANLIKSAKQFVSNSEELVKKATPQTKKIFEQTLETAKKNLKDAEDPNNLTVKYYSANYEMMKQMSKQSWENSLKEWEEKYPANHLLFIKTRLKAFLDATAEIDYNAALYEKNNRKYFVKPEYERKDNRWKMAYRAGKEVVEPARVFASQWLNEIK